MNSFQNPCEGTMDLSGPSRRPAHAVFTHSKHQVCSAHDSVRSAERPSSDSGLLDAFSAGHEDERFPRRWAATRQLHHSGRQGAGLGVCPLPSEASACSHGTGRFFCIPETQECEKFTYSGCGGNANNFVKVQDCRAACAPPPTPPPPPAPLLQEVGRSLPGDDSLSSHHIGRFFYSSKTLKCGELVFKGRGGDENRFVKIQDCVDACAPPPSPEGIWLRPMAADTRGEDVGRFSSTARSSSCAKFAVSGCGGNANAFKALEECEASCADATVCRLPLVIPPGRATFHRCGGFSTTQGKCVEIINGCKGSANQFRRECLKACC